MLTQMYSLTPFEAELMSKNMVEDNMTWNFVTGLTVAPRSVLGMHDQGYITSHTDTTLEQLRVKDLIRASLIKRRFLASSLSGGQRETHLSHTCIACYT
ncbi:hypothetical protein Bca101_027199 [Brassica carinata]